MPDFNTPAVPKFCPKGCGETIEAIILTGKELERMQRIAPHWTNHWLIKCSKCEFESYLSEGYKK